MSDAHDDDRTITDTEGEVLDAGYILIDAWKEATQGINQCYFCGIRTLSPANMNKVPEGWRKVKDGYWDSKLPARWNIWIGICPECQKVKE